MLVATPTNPVDKPRVISEIRKPYVQRSPSLDDLPRLSGVLNYYCDILGIWSQKRVCVKEGYLSVYQDTCTSLQTTARGYSSLGRATPRRTPLQHTRSDSSTNYNSISYHEGSHSLGRSRGSALVGLEFRLPLRHLNLMPCSLAPLAFCLSHHQNVNRNSSQIIFQALNEVDYDRWVKTIAVEILRQTPLDAIRFLDVLGIASLSTPHTKSYISNMLNGDCKSSGERKKNNGITKSSQIIIRWDRSPSSEGSTTSADFNLKEKQININESVTPKRLSFEHSIPRRKIYPKKCEEGSDVDCIGSNNKNIISSRKSREKIRRFRDKHMNDSSSEETRTIDEGIVLEERGSSSDRSCRRTLWPSDRSDCLDSPRSVSSYSSYELCESPETISIEEESNTNECDSKTLISVDVVDCKVKDAHDDSHLSERIYCKNVVSPKMTYNKLKKKCDKKIALIKTISEGKRIFLETMSQEDDGKWDSLTFSEIPTFKALPCNVINTNTAPSQNVNPSIERAAIKPSPEAKENISCMNKNVWNRARSCSPSKEYVENNAQETKVHSPTELHSHVEVLKQHCQSTDNYVPVKDKLVLFESLCYAGRLARSSEELSGDLLGFIAPRTRSLHDLTRERSPHVRDICEFFEKFGQKKMPCNKTKINRQDKPRTNNDKCKENNTNNSDCESLVQYKKNDNSVVCSNNNRTYSKHQTNTNPTTTKDIVNVNNSKCNVKQKDIECDDSINAVHLKIQNDTSLCDAYQYGQFKQIRLGNKIITYI